MVAAGVLDSIPERIPVIAWTHNHLRSGNTRVLGQTRTDQAGCVCRARAVCACGRELRVTINPLTSCPDSMLCRVLTFVRSGVRFTLEILFLRKAFTALRDYGLAFAVLARQLNSTSLVVVRLIILISRWALWVSRLSLTRS